MKEGRRRGSSEGQKSMTSWLRTESERKREREREEAAEGKKQRGKEGRGRKSGREGVHEERMCK